MGKIRDTLWLVRHTPLDSFGYCGYCLWTSLGDFQTVCFTISSFEVGSQFHSLHIFPSTSSKIFKHFSRWLTHHPKVSRSHLLVVPGKGHGGIDSPPGGKGKGSNSQLAPQDKELFYWRSEVGYFKKISLYQKTECNLPTQILTSFLRLFFLHQNSHPSNTRLTWYTPGRLGLGHTPQTLCCLWSRGWSPYPTFWSIYEKMSHSFQSITGCHCKWWFKCWGRQLTSSKGAFVQITDRKMPLEIVKSCGNLRKKKGSQHFGCQTHKAAWNYFSPVSMLGSLAYLSAVRSWPSGSVMMPPKATRQSNMIFKFSSLVQAVPSRFASHEPEMQNTSHYRLSHIQDRRLSPRFNHLVFMFEKKGIGATAFDRG